MVDALKERRELIQKEIEAAIARVNVLIGHQQECDYWIEHLEASDDDDDGTESG